MINYNLIIVIIGYVLCIAEVPYIYFSVKSSVKTMGACKYSFAKKSYGGMIAIDFVAAILLGLFFIRNFGKLSIILVGCCVLGVYIVTKESFFMKFYGVYEKGIISPSHIVMYDDILNFPVLQLPKEEQKHYPSNVLRVVTNSKGMFDIAFASEEQCKKVMIAMKEFISLG